MDSNVTCSVPQGRKVLSLVKEITEDSEISVKRIYPREPNEALVAYLEQHFNDNWNYSTYANSIYWALIERESDTTFVYKIPGMETARFYSVISVVGSSTVSA